VRAPSAKEAIREFFGAFPKARRLRVAAKVVGSTSATKIQVAGFDVISVPSLNLPTHCRLIHPQGIDGFSEDNLRKLAAAFVDTREQEA